MTQGADVDAARTFNEPWLGALEGLIERKGVISGEELSRYATAWKRAAARTPHGQGVELRAVDLDPDAE